MYVNKLCMGCMEEKGDTKVCPNCGWVEGTQADSPLHLKPGTILKRQYLIGRVLGHGGFGITYLALDINLGAKLAIKEYFPQGMATRTLGDPTISVYSGSTQENFQYGLEKFMEEAKTLGKFEDIPEVVSAKDFFKENGTAYLVMSYIDGITLKQYMDQNGGKLSLDMMLNIMLPIMEALEQVHKAGILHRDISPDNIYITKNYNAKLLDFGAARYAIGEHSKSLSVLLKPGYAPEEQYRSKGNQGPWTDVYAVAATMYKVLTGVTPPEALDRMEIDTIKLPSELGAEINKKIEISIMRALSVKSNNRYNNITSFYNDITGKTKTNYGENNNNYNANAQRNSTDKAQFNTYKNTQNTSAEINYNGLENTQNLVENNFDNINSNGIQNNIGYSKNTENTRNLKTTVIIVSILLGIAIVGLLGTCYVYRSLNSKYNSLKSNYSDEIEFRETLAKTIPVYITDIKIYNSKDGTVLSNGVNFNHNDIRYINCDFKANLVSEKATTKEKIIIRLINPYGRVLTYSDGSSPSGYTAAVNFTNAKFSYGNTNGNTTLNDIIGQYKIEIWYQNLEITEVYFNIN